jgi:hypothetical protein
MMKDAGINHKKAQSIKKTLSSTGSLPGSLAAPSTMSVGKQYSSTSSLGAHHPGAMNPRNTDRGRRTKAAIDLVRARTIVTPIPTSHFSLEARTFLRGDTMFSHASSPSSASRSRPREGQIAHQPTRNGQGHGEGEGEAQKQALLYAVALAYSSQTERALVLNLASTSWRA